MYCSLYRTVCTSEGSCLASVSGRQVSSVVLRKFTPTYRSQHGRAVRYGKRMSHTAIHSSPGQADQLAGMAPELKEAVEEFLKKNKVVLFMKGTKQFPQCGFSNTCVQILNTMTVPYETVNILEDESLRSGMKAYSQWPTFPQVYIDGEFVGGCDIMIETYQNGELREMLEVAINS